MEASDKFNTALIGAGEMARLMESGVPEVDAYIKSQEVAEMYLLRNTFEPNDPRLSLLSKALNSVGRWIEAGRKLPVIGKPIKWYVPFLRTPINVGISMIERSPLGALRKPGTFSDEATAKILTGSIVSMIGAMFAAAGKTTWAPPTNKDEKELFYAAKKVPYSYNILGANIPVWYFGPYALALALPAAIKYYAVDNNRAITQNGLEKLFDLTNGLARFIGSQTSTQSIGALFSVLNGDVDFKFSSATGFTVQQMIPLSSLVRFTNTVLDPVFRHPKTFFEGIEANIPFLSKNIEPYRKPYGEESTRDPVNYFLPYDIGRLDEQSKKYEQLYKQYKPSFISQANDPALQKILKDIEEKRITYEEGMTKYFETTKKINEKVFKKMEGSQK